MLNSLRAIVRATLASCAPNTATVFTNAARKRLSQGDFRDVPSREELFTIAHGEAVPTPLLETVLRKARAIYGAGMGIAGLQCLTQVVRRTHGLRWDVDGNTADILAAIDADIAQAIQSAKEELGAGRVGDIEGARRVVTELERAVIESQRDTMTWDGEFPFERGLVSLQHLKF